MRCDLTPKTNTLPKTNQGCDFANGTKLWGVKSSFSNFKCKIQTTPNFRGGLCNLPYII